MDKFNVFEIPYFKDITQKINLKENISQVYGSLIKKIPTGRPYNNNMIDNSYFFKDWEIIKKSNIKFNLLLNGYIKPIQVNSNKQELKMLLSDLNPELITFSDPTILKAIPKKYHSFQISAISGILNKHSFHNFLKNTNLNSSTIKSVVLHHDVVRKANKDLIDLLLQLRISPIILVTESCYYQCPFRSYHYWSFSESYVNRTPFINYFQLFCLIKRLKIPQSILDLSGFLLPEQIHDYIKRTNINSFKISGRSMSPEWILNTTKAYLKGQSPENLFKIIVFTSPFLEEFGMKIQDLLYLNSNAYNELYYELIEQSTPKLRKSFLKEKAAELFLNGKLKINDPNSQYDIVNGELKLMKKGDYLKRLELELDNYLISNNLQKLKATFNKSYEKVY
jgi:collagenase-like PrtC family protease